MSTEKTCGRCSHYNSAHAHCPLFTVEQATGEVYLKRVPESPACHSQYVQKLSMETVPHPFDKDAPLTYGQCQQ